MPSVAGSNAHTPMAASVEPSVEEGTEDKSELTLENAKSVGGALGANVAFLKNTEKAVNIAGEGNFDSLKKAAASEAGGASSFGSFMGVLKEAAGPLAATYGVYSAYSNMLAKANAMRSTIAPHGGGSDVGPLTRHPQPSPGGAGKSSGPVVPSVTGADEDAFAIESS